MVWLATCSVTGLPRARSGTGVIAADASVRLLRDSKTPLYLADYGRWADGSTTTR